MRGAATPLLALERERAGTFAFLIGVTCLLLMLATALILALHASARAVERQAQGRLLVQVIDSHRDARDATAAEVVRRLAGSAGVRRARRVPDAEANALIAPYIAGMAPASFTPPALIEVDTGKPDAAEQAVEDLPDVTVTRAAQDLDPVRRLLRAIEAVTIGTALLAAAASALIAILAARTALSRERATVAILHAIGATDGQIARLIGRKLTRDALLGAAGGTIVALAVVAAMLSRIAHAGLAPAGLGAGWAVLMLLPVLLVGLALGAAQTALLLHLRRAP